MFSSGARYHVRHRGGSTLPFHSTSRRTDRRTVRTTTWRIVTCVGRSSQTRTSARARTSGRAARYCHSVTNASCATSARTSSRKSGRGVQPGPWWSASSSVYGSPRRAPSRRARVVLPEPETPATATRRGTCPRRATTSSSGPRQSTARPYRGGGAVRRRIRPRPGRVRAATASPPRRDVSRPAVPRGRAPGSDDRRAVEAARRVGRQPPEPLQRPRLPWDDRRAVEAARRVGHEPPEPVHRPGLPGAERRAVVAAEVGERELRAALGEGEGAAVVDARPADVAGVDVLERRAAAHARADDRRAGPVDPDVGERDALDRDLVLHAPVGDEHDRVVRAVEVVVAGDADVGVDVAVEGVEPDRAEPDVPVELVRGRADRGDVGEDEPAGERLGAEP